MERAEGPIPVKKQGIFVLIPNDATDEELEIAAKVLNGDLPARYGDQAIIHSPWTINSAD